MARGRISFHARKPLFFKLHKLILYQGKSYKIRNIVVVFFFMAENLLNLLGEGERGELLREKKFYWRSVKAL